MLVEREDILKLGCSRVWRQILLDLDFILELSELELGVTEGLYPMGMLLDYQNMV